MRVEATPASIGIVRRAIVAYTVADGENGRSEDVELAVSEAVTNAVCHGYPGEAGHVEVTAATVERVLSVTVEDDGVGLQPVSHDPGLGFGLAIMERLADEFKLTDTGHGTAVRMRFLL